MYKVVDIRVLKHEFMFSKVSIDRYDTYLSIDTLNELNRLNNT